jgi:hypothetical protein
MILLPTPPRRVTLRAFAIVMAVPAGLALGVGAWLFGLGGPEGPAVVALGTGLTMALAGWLRPEAFEPTYRLWNRAARGFARAAAHWFSVLCFLVVTVAGAPGSRMEMRRSSGAGWARRPTLSAGAYRSSSWAPRDPGTGGFRSLFAWARDSASLWVLTLVPLLWLLRMVQTSERGSLGADIYTLY